MTAPNCSAFPSPVFAVPDGMSEQKMFMLKNQQGMTLRDYFSAKAMQGILANADDWDEEKLARLSYDVADAMLAERAK